MDILENNAQRFVYLYRDSIRALVRKMFFHLDFGEYIVSAACQQNHISSPGALLGL